MIFLLKNNIRSGISAVTGGRYVKSDEKQRFCKKMLKICMNGLWVNIYLMMKLNLIEMLNYKIY